MGSEVLPVDRALRQTEILTAAGIAVSSLEYLCSPEELAPDGTMSWKVGRTRYKWAAQSKSAWLDKVFDGPNFTAIIGLRLVASVILLTPGADRRARATAVWYLTLTNWLLHYRNSYGTDGTDHMNVLLCTSLASSTLFPNDPKAREASLWFLAGQSSLSYLASGLAKAVSAFWRDGTAISGVMRTKTYGDERLYKLLKRYPVLAKLGGIGVVAGEVAFPIALVAPKPVRNAVLGTGMAFHAANAVFMGLNRFVWAFSATYPSVRYVANKLTGGR